MVISQGKTSHVLPEHFQLQEAEAMSWSKQWLCLIRNMCNLPQNQTIHQDKASRITHK